MKRFLLVLGLPLLLLGCAGSFEEARGPSARLAASPDLTARCVSLDNMHRDWGAVAKGAGALAGGTGLAMIPVESKAWDVGLAATTATLGAVAVSAVFVSESAAASWSAECSR